MTRPTKRIAAAAMAWAMISAGPLPAAAPPAGGTISVERAVGVVDAPAPVFVDAAGAVLAAKGFTILDDPRHSALVVDLSLSRTDVGTGSAKLPRRRGTVAPGAYGGVGMGITIPLSARHAQSVPLERIQLELRMRKRGTGAVLWHGAAVTVRAAGTSQGADEVIAADLSNAILRDYPTEPPGVVSVP